VNAKTVGRCKPCRMVYRWIRSFGPISSMRCPTCKRPLRPTAWGLRKIIKEGYGMTDMRPLRKKET